MILTTEDIMIAARTVYGEARGEEFEGMKAVAHVLINRWKSRIGQFSRDDTLATTCLRNGQFSAWNQGDPNFGVIQTVSFDDKAFRLSLRAILEALEGEDTTKGSTHYHAEWASPGWAEGHTPAVQIGQHIFYVGIP